MLEYQWWHSDSYLWQFNGQLFRLFLPIFIAVRVGGGGDTLVIDMGGLIHALFQHCLSDRCVHSEQGRVGIEVNTNPPDLCGLRTLVSLLSEKSISLEVHLNFCIKN